MPEQQIVLQRSRECRGRCGNRITSHRLTVYPDEDIWTCDICGHKEVIHYEQASPSQSQGIPRDRAENIRRNLMGVVGDMQTRHWSKGMGDKDKSFIRRIIDRLIGIGRDLDE